MAKRRKETLVKKAGVDSSPMMRRQNPAMRGCPARPVRSGEKSRPSMAADEGIHQEYMHIWSYMCNMSVHSCMWMYAFFGNLRLYLL